MLSLVLHTITVTEFTSPTLWLNAMYFPETTPFPSVSLAFYLKQTAADVLHLLKHPSQKQSSTLLFGSPILNAFTEVEILLGYACELGWRTRIHFDRSPGPLVHHTPWTGMDWWTRILCNRHCMYTEICTM